MTFNIYSQELLSYNDDGCDEIYDFIVAFESPLSMTYGMINGADIDCNPGVGSN